MKTLKEIQERLAQIAAEVRKLDPRTDGEKIELLHTECAGLIEKRNALLAEEIQNRSLPDSNFRSVVGGGTVAPNTTNTTIIADGMEAREIVDTVTYRDAYIKKMQRRQLSDIETRALTTVNNAAAIPTITLNVIMGRLLAEGTLAKLVQIYNIPNWLAIPIEDSLSDAKWVAEGANGTIGEDTTKKINLIAHKLIRLIKVTREASVLSIAAFEAWIADRMVKKMQIAINKAIATGTGTGQPTGFISGTVWNNENQITVAASGLTYDNLVDLEGLIGEDYATDMVYVMNRANLAKVRKLKDDTKRPLFEREVEDGFQGTIGGIRVMLSRDVDSIYLGSWKYAWAGNFIENITFAESAEAGFLSGDTVFRALAIFDGKPTGIKGTLARINPTAGTTG